MIKNFKTIFGEAIFLPDGRWEHIEEKHPEVKKCINCIREVLLSPDLVKISKKDPHVHLYYKYFPDILNGKYILVVTNSMRKIVVTLFITDKIKAGEMLWQKK